jgi:hypothetical protein
MVPRRKIVLIAGAAPFGAGQVSATGAYDKIKPVSDADLSEYSVRASTPGTPIASIEVRVPLLKLVKKKVASQEGKGRESPSRLISASIKALGDSWGAMLARIRRLVKRANPEVVEEWKWRRFRYGRTSESAAPVRRTRRT